MKAIAEMSNEEILRAIDICMDTGTNFTSHGQSDDYMVGSMKMAQVYREEIKRREQNSRVEKEICVDNVEIGFIQRITARNCI